MTFANSPTTQYLTSLLDSNGDDEYNKVFKDLKEGLQPKRRLL